MSGGPQRRQCVSPRARHAAPQLKIHCALQTLPYIDRLRLGAGKRQPWIDRVYLRPACGRFGKGVGQLLHAERKVCLLEIREQIAQRFFRRRQPCWPQTIRCLSQGQLTRVGSQKSLGKQRGNPWMGDVVPLDNISRNNLLSVRLQKGNCVRTRQVEGCRKAAAFQILGERRLKPDATFSGKRIHARRAGGNAACSRVFDK